MRKLYIILTYFFAAMMTLVIITTNKRNIENKQRIRQLNTEKKALEKQLQVIEYKTDSLKMIINNIETLKAPQIQTQIITKYEKEFDRIHSLNATNSFIEFSSWLSTITNNGNK